MHNPLTKIDFYKADHRRQYPEGTTMVYSNFTPRKSRIPGIDHIVFFGLQYVVIQYLMNDWIGGFFSLGKDTVIREYKRRMDNALGKDAIPVDHIEALHDLGYLPLEIKALPEGSLVPMRIPCFTIRNTKPEFFWLVNYLETVLSNKIWKACTSATIAFQYRKVFEEYYKSTVDDCDENGVIMWQGHDFSYRGMSGDEDACTSGAGHLLSFYGTDTVPAIDFLEEYYGADSDYEIVGGSVPATEHSVMCMGEQDGEFSTFKRLITELYPSGIVAIVSDTWDYWQVINEYLPALKADIMSRTGSPTGINKVVIRPDSGDPYRIICGYFPEELHEREGKVYPLVKEDGIYIPDFNKSLEEWEIKGSVQCLWDTFGGSYTTKGFRQLAPCIGLIYGDSITLERQKQILDGLRAKGFASTNVVLGIGSFTYEYQTRDTFGFAMKATYGEIYENIELSVPENDRAEANYVKVGRNIFKQPKTDDGTKNSAKGLLSVAYDENQNKLVLFEECTWEEEQQGLLETVFKDGNLVRHQILPDIRKRINTYLK
jgi:nicotinamide phosphoribosyltransferase